MPPDVCAVESFSVVLMLYREEKLARMEFFELKELDTALAHFDELRAAPAEETKSE